MSVSLPPPPSRAERAAQALATDHLMADLGRRTASGGAIAVSAQVVRLALQLATMAILARLLAPADFGLVAMAATVTALVGMFTDLGLSAATVQRKEIDQDTVSALFFINLAMGVLVMGAVIALAPVAAWFFDDPRIRWVVTALALPIPLLAASRQHAALLQRGMRWIAIEWTAIAAQAVAGIAAILIAWRTDLGYWALVAQGWISAVLTLALLWAVCPWRPSRVRDWSKARAALGFGLHLTGFNFLNYFNRQFDNVLIGWRWGAGELGYYTRAYALLMLPISVINGPVGSAVIPALSRMQNDPERWRKAYLRSMVLVVTSASGLGVVLCTASYSIVIVIYGQQWDFAATLFAVLSFSIFPSALVSTTGWIFISLGQTNRMLFWSLRVTPVRVICFSIGVLYGAQGVAVAWTLTNYLFAFPLIVYATRIAPVSVTQIARLAVPMIVVGSMCGLIGLLAATQLSHYNVMFFVLVPVGTCLLYILIIFILFFTMAQYKSLYHTKHFGVHDFLYKKNANQS